MDIFLSSCLVKLCCSNHVQPEDELIKTAVAVIATAVSLLQVLLNKCRKIGKSDGILENPCVFRHGRERCASEELRGA